MKGHLHCAMLRTNCVICRISSLEFAIEICRGNQPRLPVCGYRLARFSREMTCSDGKAGGVTSDRPIYNEIAGVTATGGSAVANVLISHGYRGSRDRVARRRFMTGRVIRISMG